MMAKAFHLKRKNKTSETPAKQEMADPLDFARNIAARERRKKKRYTTLTLTCSFPNRAIAMNTMEEMLISSPIKFGLKNNPAGLGS